LGRHSLGMGLECTEPDLQVYSVGDTLGDNQGPKDRSFKHPYPTRRSSYFPQTAYGKATTELAIPESRGLSTPHREILNCQGRVRHKNFGLEINSSVEMKEGISLTQSLEGRLK